MKAILKAENMGQKVDKYLTFMLADEQYGVQILKVLEIVGLMDITPVPQTPHYLKGVINLRGKMIPVVGLRQKLDMPEGELTALTCIVVVQVGRVEIGLLVDKVLEVVAISADNIDETPCFGAGVETDFILGLAKANHAVTILLDIDQVLKDNKIIDLKEAANLRNLARPPELAAM
jgi:purine-binding chemotaxis protein CheW